MMMPVPGEVTALVFILAFVALFLSWLLREEWLRRFETEVRDCPEVMSCHLVAGDADYLLHLAVKDHRDFERIHNRHLSRLPGVARLRSNFAIRTIYQTTRHVL